MIIKLYYADFNNAEYDSGIRKIDNYGKFIYEDAVQYAKLKYWLDRKRTEANKIWSLIMKQFIKDSSKDAAEPNDEKSEHKKQRLNSERAKFLRTEVEIISPCKISRDAVAQAGLSPAEIRGIYKLLEADGKELDGFGSIGDSIIFELDNTDTSTNDGDTDAPAVVLSEESA